MNKKNNLVKRKENENWTKDIKIIPDLIVPWKKRMKLNMKTKKSNLFDEQLAYYKQKKSVLYRL